MKKLMLILAVFGLTAFTFEASACDCGCGKKVEKKEMKKSCPANCKKACGDKKACCAKKACSDKKACCAKKACGDKKSCGAKKGCCKSTPQKAKCGGCK